MHTLHIHPGKTAALQTKQYRSASEACLATAAAVSAYFPLKGYYTVNIAFLSSGLVGSAVCATAHMPSYEAGNFKLDYTGKFPDQLKLIKTFEVFPLEVTAIGSLNPRTQKWSYSVGCRDVILNGKITYNAERSAVEYRKVLPFPVFGGITKPVLAAEWPVRFDSWRDNWRKPRLQLGLSVDDTPSSNDDGANLNTNGTLSFRKKAFLTRRWGVEVDGNMRFSFQHDLASGADPGAVASAMGLHVEAKQLNIVCRI